MSPERARAILAALANGVNPVNGEILSTDHFMQDRDVVRALYLALAALPKSEA